MHIIPRAASYETLAAAIGRPYRWLILIVVAIGTVAGVLSTSSFNIAVPSLSHQFGLGHDQVQWTMTGFMAAMTVSMLPTPWFLDRFGFRTVFLSAISLLLVTSLAGYLAPTFPLIVLARVIQGAATGVLTPLGPLSVMRLFPIETQGRASGLLTFSIVMIPAVAPAIAGYLLDQFGWRSIFLLNIPFCIVGGIAALYLLPLPKEIINKAFDWLGVCTLGAGTIALIEAVASLQHNGLASLWTISPGLLAVAAFVFFVRHAKRTQTSIINLDLFAIRTFAMGTIVSFVYGFGLYSSTYLFPVYLQTALGYSATAAGALLIPSGILLTLIIPFAGRMADSFAPKLITSTGLTMMGLSFLAFTLLGGHATYSQLISITIFSRLGLGLILPALNLATLQPLKSHQLGQSSVVISYARQLGGVLGIAIVAVFIAWQESRLGSQAPAIYSVYARTFLLLAVVFFLALISASLMKNTPKARHAQNQ